MRPYGFRFWRLVFIAFFSMAEVLRRTVWIPGHAPLRCAARNDEVKNDDAEWRQYLKKATNATL